MARQQGQQRRDILTEFPASTYQHLIVRWGHRHDDSSVAFGFAEAADRLAESCSGEPRDDTILLPFLYLYRHAIELELKTQIHLAAKLRRTAGAPDPDLAYAAVKTRLKDKHGHRLMALVAEFNSHLTALELESVPADVNKILQRISSADPHGESFRYAGSLPESDDRIDFNALHEALKYAYSMVSAAGDMLSEYADYLDDMMADYRAAEADFVNEQIAEYFEDYGR